MVINMATKTKIRNRIRLSTSEKIGMTIVYIAIILLSACFLVPFLYVISASFTSEAALANYGVTLIPKEFSSAAYKFLFKYSEDIIRSSINTVIIAVSTSVLMIIVTSMFAYPLAKKDFPGRTAILGYVLFSMLFGGGMVPTYILMNEYGFADSWLCMILPGCFSAWNMILVRNYFSALPAELEESAFIDGAGYMKILFRIIIPLSKPILATLTLFVLVGSWNNWYSALLYLSNQKDLWPIMMFLKTVLESTNPSTTMGMPVSGAFPPTECLKMAAVVVCTAPILASYPFLQRYFVKGIMIGSVKG
ncbi:MAG: carbohydrate ABC transporter permease [Ruminococcaceae bacterium]|nr:carbohydrate ABC transporter permease [Oscillospiraceae bacterium]MBE6903184.1 carbohydrate ABC transporter permease [Oscillospiraceae bacterium]